MHRTYLAAILCVFFFTSSVSANLVCPWEPDPPTYPVPSNTIESSLTGACIGILYVTQGSLWRSMSDASGLTGTRFDLLAGTGATVLDINTTVQTTGYSNRATANREVSYEGMNAILYDAYAAEDVNPVDPTNTANMTTTPVCERVSGGVDGNFDYGTYQSGTTITNTPGSYLGIQHQARAGPVIGTTGTGMSGNMHTWDSVNTMWGPYPNGSSITGVDLWTQFEIDSYWRGLFIFQDIFNYNTKYVEV